MTNDFNCLRSYLTVRFFLSKSLPVTVLLYTGKISPPFYSPSDLRANSKLVTKLENERIQDWANKFQNIRLGEYKAVYSV